MRLSLEVEPTPARRPVLLTIRAGFNHLRQFRQLIRRKGKGLGPSVQLSTRPSRPDPLKRWTQSRSVWRSIPPIFAAEPRSAPTPEARQPNNPLAISPLKPWRDPPRQLESAPPRFGNPPNESASRAFGINFLLAGKRTGNWKRPTPQRWEGFVSATLPGWHIRQRRTALRALIVASAVERPQALHPKSQPDGE